MLPVRCLRAGGCTLPQHSAQTPRSDPKFCRCHLRWGGMWSASHLQSYSIGLEHTAMLEPEPRGHLLFRVPLTPSRMQTQDLGAEGVEQKPGWQLNCMLQSWRSSSGYLCPCTLPTCFLQEGVAEESSLLSTLDYQLCPWLVQGIFILHALHITSSSQGEGCPILDQPPLLSVVAPFYGSWQMYFPSLNLPYSLQGRTCFHLSPVLYLASLQFFMHDWNVTL